jgi:hypothetical protein
MARQHTCSHNAEHSFTHSLREESTRRKSPGSSTPSCGRVSQPFSHTTGLSDVKLGAGVPTWSLLWLPLTQGAHKQGGQGGFLGLKPAGTYATKRRRRPHQRRHRATRHSCWPLPALPLLLHCC